MLSDSDIARSRNQYLGSGKSKVQKVVDQLHLQKAKLLPD